MRSRMVLASVCVGLGLGMAVYATAADKPKYTITIRQYGKSAL